MGDDLLRVPGVPAAGALASAYPPIGTRATIETPSDEDGMLKRAGRYGWRAVSFTMTTWTLQFEGVQWDHSWTFFSPPSDDAWVRIGRWWFFVYWARPLGLPVMPGNPAPEDFASEKKLRKALSRAGVGRSSGSAVVAGLLDGVREFVEEATTAVEEALGGVATTPAPLPVPLPVPQPAPLPVPLPVPVALPGPPVDLRLFDASDAGMRLRDALTRLAHLAPVYAGYAIEGQPVPGRLERIVGDLQDLFRRMHARGTAQQRAVAQSQYAHILGQLLLVVAPTYLKDVMDNPHLWSDADRRVAVVGDALTAVDSEILTNIRQVNASADLDFQVALKTITALGNDDEVANLYGTGPA